MESLSVRGLHDIPEELCLSTLTEGNIAVMWSHIPPRPEKPHRDHLSDEILEQPLQPHTLSVYNNNSRFNDSSSVPRSQQEVQKLP